jgi:hypothetical protein
MKYSAVMYNKETKELVLLGEGETMLQAARFINQKEEFRSNAGAWETSKRARAGHFVFHILHN